jgi:hypothetical protein
MRIFIGLTLAIFILGISSNSFATSHTEKSAYSTSMITDNPGTTAGIAACGVAVAFFPPALLVCGGTIVTGAAVDAASE